MIEDVINAVAVALSGYGFDIYNDTIPQGLSTPCFIVEEVDIQTQNRTSDRVKQTFNLAINFLCDSNILARQISEEVPLKLKVVSFKNVDYMGTVRENNLDNTEHTVAFVVSFSVYKEKTKESNIMQIMKARGTVR